MSRRDVLVFLSVPAIVCAMPAWADDYLTVSDAQKSLFPKGTEFADQPVALTKEQKKAIRSLSGVTQRNDRQAVWKVHENGRHAGWFIVDDVVGKHEFITYAAALSPDGKVIGIEILSYRETHGAQIREASWRGKLAGKTLADPFVLDRDVPNISGATLSCRNVMNGVKRLLALQKVCLGHG